MNPLRAIVQWLRNNRRKVTLLACAGWVAVTVAVMGIYLTSSSSLMLHRQAVEMEKSQITHGFSQGYIYELLVEGDHAFRRGEYDAALLDYQRAQRYISSLNLFYANEIRGAELAATRLVVDNRLLTVTAAQRLREL